VRGIEQQSSVDLGSRTGRKRQQQRPAGRTRESAPLIARPNAQSCWMDTTACMEELLPYHKGGRLVGTAQPARQSLGLLAYCQPHTGAWAVGSTHLRY